MTINEAIAHAMKVAEQNDAQAEKWREEGGEEWGKTTTCRECAADHRQLVEWLIELKDLREENKMLISECDRLIKEKEDLLSKVSGGDVLRICQLEEQLEKAKRLLKVAVEDIHELLCDRKDLDGIGQSCNICGYIDDCPCCKRCDIIDELRVWRYADEALKLIGED